MARHLAPRLQEKGRIRIGERHEGVTKTGKKYTSPRRLGKFRFTSSDQFALAQLAALYGGDVKPWPDAPTAGQFQLYSEASTLSVILPSTQAFSVNYERWQGSACLFRCDGQCIQFDASRAGYVPGSLPCQCEESSPDRCPMVARISVMLQGVEGLGVWRLDTRSHNGAVAMQGIIQVLEAQSIRRPVPCLLRVEERERTTFENNAEVMKRLNISEMQAAEIAPRERKIVTRKFPVVSLQPTMQYEDLLQLASGIATQHLLPEPTRESTIARGISAAEELYGGMHSETNQEDVDRKIRESLLAHIAEAMAAKGIGDASQQSYLLKLCQACDVPAIADIPLESLQKLYASIPAWSQRVTERVGSTVEGASQASSDATRDEPLPF